MLLIIFCSQIKGNNLQLKSCPSLQLFKIQESPNYQTMRKNMCPKLQFRVFRKAKQSVCYIQVFKPERYETKVCPQPRSSLSSSKLYLHQLIKCNLEERVLFHHFYIKTLHIYVHACLCVYVCTYTHTSNLQSKLYEIRYATQELPPSPICIFAQLNHISKASVLQSRFSLFCSAGNFSCHSLHASLSSTKQHQCIKN